MQDLGDLLAFFIFINIPVRKFIVEVELDFPGLTRRSSDCTKVGTFKRPVLVEALSR